MTFLGNWALIVLVIACRFLLNSCLFLIRGYWGEQFKFTIFPNALNVVSRIFSLDCSNILPHV